MKKLKSIKNVMMFICLTASGNAMAQSKIINCVFFNDDNQSIATFKATMPVQSTVSYKTDDGAFLINAVLKINDNTIKVKKMTQPGSLTSTSQLNGVFLPYTWTKVYDSPEETGSIFLGLDRNYKNIQPGKYFAAKLAKISVGDKFYSGECRTSR